MKMNNPPIGATLLDAWRAFVAAVRTSWAALLVLLVPMAVLYYLCGRAVDAMLPQETAAQVLRALQAKNNVYQLLVFVFGIPAYVILARSAWRKLCGELDSLDAWSRIKEGFGGWWRVVAVMLSIGLAIRGLVLVASLAAELPGFKLVMSLVMVVMVTVLAVRWTFAVPLVALPGPHRGFALLRVSREFVRGRWWHVLFFLCAMGLAGLALAVVPFCARWFCRLVEDLASGLFEGSVFRAVRAAAGLLQTVAFVALQIACLYYPVALLAYWRRGTAGGESAAQ